LRECQSRNVKIHCPAYGEECTAYICGEIFTNRINDLKNVSFDSIIEVVRLYQFDCGQRTQPRQQVMPQDSVYMGGCQTAALRGK
jgi:hypothetical protein